MTRWRFSIKFFSPGPHLNLNELNNPAASCGKSTHGRLNGNYSVLLQNPKIWSHTFRVDCSGGMTFQKSDFGRSSRK
jgi:hypothetical protein